MSGDGWSEKGECIATLSEQLLCGAGLVLEPLPVGAWAFLSVTAAIFTKTLTFSQAFSAFTNDVIWLIVVSFFFAKVCENLVSCVKDCHDVYTNGLHAFGKELTPPICMAILSPCFVIALL
jgi:hypothetical protein